MDVMQRTHETPSTMSNPPGHRTEAEVRQQRKVERTIRKRSFATLATTSAAGRAHVAGVVYDTVDGDLWVHTMRTSRKARSVARNSSVGVCIPFRRLPVGPPYTIHFQATAEIVEMDDPRVTALVDDGHLTRLTGHDALDMPGAVFVRIRPNGTVHSYGLGVNPLRLMRDPLRNGAATVHLGQNGVER